MFYKTHARLEVIDQGKFKVVVSTDPRLMLVGLILFAHASMDRAIGTGLKYFDGFWHISLSTAKFW